MTVLDIKQQIKSEVDIAENKLIFYANKYRLPNGLIPDEYKTEEYKKLKKEFDIAFSKLRQINTLYRKYEK